MEPFLSKSGSKHKTAWLFMNPRGLDYTALKCGGRPTPFYTQACEPSWSDDFQTLLHLDLLLFSPKTSLYVIYKSSFGQTLYYQLQIILQVCEWDWEGKAFVIYLFPVKNKF